MELVLIGHQPLASQAGFLTFASGTSSLTIDARRLGFVSPLDIAGIVALAHSSGVADVAISFLLPENSEVAGYLRQAGVLDAMPERTTFHGHANPGGPEYPANRLLRVSLLTTDTVRDVADQFGHLVASNYPHNAGLAMSRACNELLANAEEHGRSLPGAFIAAQVYTGETTDSPRLELAVCDNGIGVLAHLKRNPKWDFLTRDEQALDHARRAWVTGTSDRRGNGLPDLVETAHKYGDIRLHLRSGFGEITVSKSNAQFEARVRTRPDQTEGTWAWLTHQVNSTGHSVLKLGK